jgi:hypothetical protein
LREKNASKKEACPLPLIRISRRLEDARIKLANARQAATISAQSGVRPDIKQGEHP